MQMPQEAAQFAYMKPVGGRQAGQECDANSMRQLCNGAFRSRLCVQTWSRGAED